MAQEVPDWLRLQRKIFSRWVNQKIAKKGIHIEDVVKEINTGIVLIALVEELSEKQFTEKIEKAPKLRAQLVDNASRALKFAFSSGIEMKIKPSAEDLVDGDEKNILGLIWAIMLKFIKIGDEDDGEQLNAKDALLLWVKNKVAGYENVSVDNFKKSFQDGLALCALIHKHRPKLIPWETLNKEDKIGNLQHAINAAEKYFGLEKYLAAEDIPKLDENSMVIYVSDYYYGIAEQRKLDLAARRIGKLIKFTEENDSRRAEYTEISAKEKAHIAQVKVILEDRTIDNTLAGAKKRLEDFYAYKGKDKNEIIADQLTLEGIFNNLSMRLKTHKRPDFVPADGCTLKEFADGIKSLEENEKFQNVALHAELNRQIKLVKLNEHHQSIFGKLKPWIAEKEAYLRTKEIINSVSGALLNLKLLDAYEQESASVHETSIAELLKIGAELVAEKFEHSASVTEREAEVNTGSATLAELAKAKRPVLDDHLARELFKEKVRLMNLQHTDKYQKLESWVAEKETYLNTKEVIASISEAQTQLGLLEGYEKERVDVTETAVVSHKALGEDILAQKYETQYSSYVWEKPDEIRSRLSFVETKWNVLAELSAEKKRVLDDHLARELFKEKVRQMNHTHTNNYNRLHAWLTEKENYLNTREVVDSISEAQSQLGILEAYETERKNTEPAVNDHQNLGQDILAQKYETKYSSYVWERPDEIKARTSHVETKWALLVELSAEKKRVLDDHLAREIFKEKVRQLNHNHADKHAKLQAWIAEKEAYLNKKEEIDSISEAQTALSLLGVFEDDKKVQTETAVAKHQALGLEILAQKYETKYSSYVWEKPDEISGRNNFVDQKWALLGELGAAKKKVLEEDLAREQEKERLRLEFASLAGQYTRWAKDTTEKVAISQFGFTLAEVEAYQNVLNKSNSDIEAHISTTQSLYNAAYNKGKDLGVKENAYTTLTPDDLAKSGEHVKTALEARTNAYNAELLRQRENDALCKQFADLVEPLSKVLFEYKEAISGSAKELEEQLKFVEERVGSLESDGSKLPEIKSLDATIKSKNIIQNIHTNLTAQDVDVQYQQYQLFLTKKKKMLEEEVENKKLRGISVEDYKEIEENFKQFDYDKSGNIDKKELKACLYSLGEEKTRSEIDAIIKEYGNASGKVSHERFKDFMIVVYGDTDTEDEIVNGFKLINRGDEVAKVEKMELVMAEHDVEYVKNTAPKLNDGFDYVSWTKGVFAR